MSLWQLAACIDGWNKAHGGQGDQNLTENEINSLIEGLDRPPVWKR